MSRRERCLDKPQKLLKKARIGMMQKNWMKKDTATWLWHCRPAAITQRVGSLLQFVQRVPVAGAGLGSLLLFARQLPVVCLARPRMPWPRVRRPPRPPARDQSTRLRTQAAEQDRTRWTHRERPPDWLRHCVPGTCHNTRHTPVVPSSSASVCPERGEVLV